MLLKFYLMLVLVFRLGDKPTKNGDLAVFYLYYFIAREITNYSIVTALLLIFCCLRFHNNIAKPYRKSRYAFIKCFVIVG